MGMTNSIRRFSASLIAASTLLALAPPSFGHDSGSSVRFARNGLQSCRSTRIADFDGTIVDAAIATPALSTLKDLVVSAGLAGALSGTGPFTVFAPTNDAFAKIPGPVLAAIGGDAAVLTSVLTYHVVSGIVDPRLTLFPREVSTLQGQTLFIEQERAPQVNQSTAACQGVRTRNGIVWIIDSVLLPQFK